MVRGMTFRNALAAAGLALCFVSVSCREVPELFLGDELSSQFQISEVQSKAPWKPRDGAGFVQLGDALYLLGGYTKDPVLSNDVWRSYDGVEWEKLVENAPWEPRHGAGVFSFQDRMWIMGGDGHDDVWSSADGENWTLEKDHVEFGMRYGPYITVFQDKIWLMGGQWGWTPSDLVYFNDVWVSEDGRTWTQVLENAPWPGRALVHGSAVLNGYIYILGGGVKAPIPGEGTLSVEIFSYRDVWRSADGINWELVKLQSPWGNRIHSSIAAWDGKLWISGGSEFTPEHYLLGDLWYSSDGIEWHEVPNVPWAPRHAASLFVFKGSLWMGAGFLFNDLWRIDHL